MANFGDILLEWETEKKKGNMDPNVPQDGRAWRNKKTEPEKTAKKNEVGMNETEDTKEPSVNPMDFWLRRYGVVDKDKEIEKEEDMASNSSRDYIKNIPCEASLDLHGLTRDQAWKRLNTFVTECYYRGLCKVLLIHGKGNHSEDDPVLHQVVRSFIESDNRLGQFGFADKNLGGKGATWVIIREKIEK